MVLMVLMILMVLMAGDVTPTSYLVIYGGASPEEGPLGDTVYAALPPPDDIGTLHPSIVEFKTKRKIL